ncbi:Kinase-like protein [Mycena sanguinolenta]|uniref:Kinase-like protein n=1 Tax=Mycena sanguinolenta TaxID=230812 RepID=A0A8H6Y2E8_9AGAR|nr:Kinase-like protein [Mycena sanguinolenta]
MSFYSTTPRAGAVPPLPNLAGTFVDEGYLKLEQLISSDNFIQIYKALDTTTDTHYSVKCTRTDTPPPSRLTEEFSIHQSVSHQIGVATLNRMFEEDGRTFMILNPAAGTMGENITKFGMYVDRPDRIKGAFIELVEAVTECHHAGVYHRDLRPRNIWCDSRGWGLRLANFGKATRKAESDEFGCGRPAYMSPECADTTRGSYSPRESDLWALAVILFNMVTGSNPWRIADFADASYAAYRSNEDTHFIETCHLTPAANDFFRRCFASQSEQRPSLEEMAVEVLAIDRFSLAHTFTVHSRGQVHSALLEVHNVNAPDLRFVDRAKRSITTRERFAKKVRRA